MREEFFNRVTKGKFFPFTLKIVAEAMGLSPVGGLSPEERKELAKELYDEKK